MVVLPEWGNFVASRKRCREDDDDSDDGTDRTSNDEIGNIILDRLFWAGVIDALKVTAPIMQLLFAADNKAQELMGKVYYKMFSIGNHMSNMERNISWATEAKRFHAERWEYMHSRMHAAGYALDPEYLYTGDGGPLDCHTTEGLMEVVERLSLRHIIQRAVDKDAARMLTANSSQVQALAAECMIQFASFRAQEGPLTKNMCVESAKRLPPSQWWQTYCAHLPDLQQVACTVLKQPISACAAERNWSVYAQIKTHARSSMQHEVADKRVYCHEALHHQAKLQAASHRMEVASWEGMSDSDSDDSDVDDADDAAFIARINKSN